MLLHYIQSLEDPTGMSHRFHFYMGKTKILYRIKELFMWYSMVKDVISLVSSLFYCMVLLYFLYFKFNPGSVIFLQLSKWDVCQCMNKKLTPVVPELHPIPVKAPWYMVGIDFIGPLSPVAKLRSRYILTISDYFPKWDLQSTK